MGNRRLARECALQLLYQAELSGKRVVAAPPEYWSEAEADHETRDFSLRLVQGVDAERAVLDELIDAHSTNWKMSRMAAVDRNILRIAAFELLHCDDIPAKVAINEAVEIAKRFGTTESGAFVNGILDALAKKTPPRSADTETTEE